MLTDLAWPIATLALGLLAHSSLGAWLRQRKSELTTASDLTALDARLAAQKKGTEAALAEVREEHAKITRWLQERELNRGVSALRR